jgi:bifunctional oligoribonuclease and PAP phosphatase NrnA
MFDQIKEIIDGAQRIVVLQADNPDADSLGSALALEAILSDQGKDVALYCAVDIPGYLKYLTGWSRVLRELPKNFDASIIVDTSTRTLFEKSIESGEYQWLGTKPCIVIDHHAETANDIEFATVVLNPDSASSTAEVIYDFAKQAYGSIPTDAFDPIMTGILGDTQGLTNQLATAHTYEIMSELIAAGADRPALEELRREGSKMHESIFRYKGQLIERTEFANDNQIAYVSIPQAELITYSPLYNPGPLIQPDMLQTDGVRVGIVFKVYDDGKITGMIRCNAGAEIANKIAVRFGGGGHGFAAGFKITDGKPFNEVKSECIAYTTELLTNLDQD